MQPFARFRYFASTADPGPTAWRLLQLETHELSGTLLSKIRVTGVIKRSSFNKTKSPSITVGLLIAPENTAPVSADTGASVLPILPVSRADISRFAKKRKRKREREEKEKIMRREEGQNVRTREKDGAEKKRKKEYP
ncbi:hypothetical protein V1477_019038 [Vespula maculifrons]|uniref:Uncharacterized protein n=1 Tax=Vespula maculifrons TaxID=7453 RepID=A0ABD2AT86_VESMC